MLNVQCSMFNVEGAPGHSTLNIQHSTFNIGTFTLSCPMPHAPCPMPHARRLMPHASCLMPMPHASCLETSSVSEDEFARRAVANRHDELRLLHFALRQKCERVIAGGVAHDLR